MKTGHTSWFELSLAVVLLLLSLGTLLFFLFHPEVLSGEAETRSRDAGRAVCLLLATAAGIVPLLLLQTRRAFREWMTYLEHPPSKESGFAHEERIRLPGTAPTVPPSCLRALREHFSQVYAFQAYHPPFVHHLLLGKRNATRLFALPCLELGFLALLLYLSAYLHLPTLRQGQPWHLLPATALVLCWVSAIVLLCRGGYRKAWLRIQQEVGATHVSLILPARLARRRRLRRELERSLTVSLRAEGMRSAEASHSP